MRGAIGRGLGRELPCPESAQLDMTVAAIDARPADSKVKIWPAPGDAIHSDQDFVAGLLQLARDKGWAGAPTARSTRPTRTCTWPSTASAPCGGSARPGCSGLTVISPT